MSERPPICPPDRHDLVCHCGSEMAGHPAYDNHGPVLMGCAVCRRTPEELDAQGPWEAIVEGVELSQDPEGWVLGTTDPGCCGCPQLQRFRITPELAQMIKAELAAGPIDTGDH